MRFLDRPYVRAILSLLATLAAIAAPLLTGDHTGVDYVNVAIMAAGSVAVWAAANFSVGIAKYTKTGMQALTAGLVILQSALNDGITLDEWKQIAIAVVTVILMPVLRDSQYIPADQRVPLSTDAYATGETYPTAA